MPDDEKFEDLPWHILYFQAFDALQFDRSYGEVSERPIFYSAISQFCADRGITGADRGRFETFINAIDAEYLKFAAERAEEAQKAQKLKDVHKASLEHR